MDSERKWLEHGQYLLREGEITQEKAKQEQQLDMNSFSMASNSKSKHDCFPKVGFHSADYRT